MSKLRETIRQKRTELWKNQLWILTQDNAPKNKTVIMPQPPCTPDLAHVDLFLFIKLKTPMKGKHFATIEEIQEKSKQELLTITKERFHKYIISF